ncbi:MAG: hypothetical protein JXQ95_13130 [Alteromonas stellipolaris]|nr:hypothetical protein [Alteromonas sp. MMG017]MBZ2160791.1 substrate-binding domain-containing protein [Alteromonas stellipolaris]
MVIMLALIKRIRALTSNSEYSALMLSMLFLACSPVALAQQAVVVANESVDNTSLTQSELRQIFTGHKQYWSNGEKIHVVVLEDVHILHKTFCRENIQMFPYQLSRLWDQLTYSGQGVTPTRVSSQEALLNMVENTVGAIGYADISKVKDVQVIEVREQ